MKSLLLVVYLLYAIDAKPTPRPRVCRNCTGKIHTKQDLELAKLPLVIDKNRICTTEKYEFFIIVKSGSFSRRNFTRSTWAKEIKEHFNIPVLYAIGYPKDSSLQSDIVAEEENFHDLLQFDILESYYNLTIKSTSVLLWYDQHCSKNSGYLFYVDDDVLIHVEQFITYIMRLNYSDTIEGWFEKSGKILRTGVGGVTKEDFPIDTVPDYLWGAAVLYPSNIVSNVLLKFIFNTSLPIFFRDDVFINAFVAEEAGVKRQHMKGLLLYDPTEDALKTNMIVIDFTSENDRRRAWNCYKHNKQCNRNPLWSLFKATSGISVCVLSIFSFYKWLKSMKCCHYLLSELRAWYREIKPVWDENVNLILVILQKFCPTIRCRKVKFTIRLILRSKKVYIRAGFLFVVLLVLYYFVMNK